MKKPAHITMVNGVETSAIDIADRGLAYGDGLFETMRVIGDDVPLLSLHIKRFLKGVAVLGLGDEARLKQNFIRYTKQALSEIKNNACLDSSLIKIMITRGKGGRGYIPPEEAHCNFIVQVFDLPSYPASYSSEGVVIRECQYRLGFQPQLAGIKHLNRLDQVLASQELLNEPEGLLLDYENNVVEGTKSNVLVFKGRKILTPELKATGVHGVLRQALIEPSYDLKSSIEIADINVAELVDSDGLAMVNSVFGIWFVKTLILQDGKEINFKQPAEFENIRAYLAQHYSY